MKVTHLVTFFEPSFAGGIQRYVGEVARLQRRIGIDASVLTVTLPVRRHPVIPTSGMSEWSLENQKLPITASNAWAVLFRTPFCPPLLNNLRHIKADIVHIHGPSPWLEFAVRLAQPQAKLVLTVHNSFPNTTLAERLLSRYAGHILQNTMDSVNAIIVPSRVFLEEVTPGKLLKKYNARIHVVPPGVNHNHFYNLALRRDEQLVLFVGHLRHEKGLHVLIEALALMSNCKLLVLASVSYESEYFQKVRRLAIEKLGERAAFVLNPDYRTLLEAYNKAVCVVVPSIGLESWNLVLLEAAACGAACVRSGLPSLAWADFAGVAPPGDALALADVIRRVLEQRPVFEMAALSASQGYSWELTASKSIEVYREVAT